MVGHANAGTGDTCVKRAHFMEAKEQSMGKASEGRGLQKIQYIYCQEVSSFSEKKKVSQTHT